MLYSIFLYQTKTGLLIWRKTFETGLESKSELFSSFFSAIQNFVKELVIDETNSKGLQAIDMGNFVVNITQLPNLEIDIVAIADKDDAKPIRKFLPKVIKILNGHKELFNFAHWDGNQSLFNVLDVEILQLLQTHKKLTGSGKSLADGRKEVLGQIIDAMPEVEQDKIEYYMNEVKYLEDRMKKEVSIYRKLEIIDSIEQVYQKLKNKNALEEIHRRRRKLSSELRDLKTRLNFYLIETKKNISTAVENAKNKAVYDIDFKNAYMSFYSFASKLKLLGQKDLSEEYQHYAKTLIEKPKDFEDEFSAMISKILHLNDDIESYIPQHAT